MHEQTLKNTTGGALTVGPSSKLRVLYLITRAERGGGQVHVLDLIKGLHRDCETELATGEEGFLVDEARALGVRCHVVPSLVQPMRPSLDLRALFSITRLISERKPHLVHAHTSKAGVIGRCASFLSRTPSVFTAHTWCFAEGTARTWKLVGVPLERISARLGDAIITVSEYNRNLALRQKVARSEVITTIHNGIPELLPTPGENKLDPPVIVMIARMAPQKGHQLMLRALPKLTHPFRLLFVGGGPMESHLKKLCAELNQTSKVEFLGNRSDVSSILKRASIFALISNYESFPISILEAMRAKLPVVASDVGGVREAVVTGVNGFLVKKGDVDEVATALDSLLASEQLRTQMGERSREMFTRHFTAEIMLSKTLNVYRQVLSSREGSTVTDQVPVELGSERAFAAAANSGNHTVMRRERSIDTSKM
jgi:glycosyltransferase involved in cell wall biosynthesis